MIKHLLTLPRSQKLLILTGLFFAALIATVLLFPHKADMEQQIIHCMEAGDKKQQCLGDLVTSEAKQDGISPAFDLLAELYSKDNEFAMYCHGNTHTLGEIAYEDFKQKKD